MPAVKPPVSPLRFEDVRALAHTLPEVEVGTSYGTPALKVRGKLMARLREDGTTLVLKVPFVVRDHLLETAPAAYFLTDHYREYPTVLVRLDVVDPVHLASMLEEAWRQVATKRVVREYEAGQASGGGD